MRMKKRKRGTAAIIATVSMIWFAAIIHGQQTSGAFKVFPRPEQGSKPEKQMFAPAYFVGGVEENGWLQVKDGKLCNEAGDPFQLCGMSSHGLSWFPEYTSVEAIGGTLAQGANLFRVAMYVGDEPGQYTANPQEQQQNMQALTQAVDNTLSLNMYAIADWHILEDGNPLNRLEDALVFFDELSGIYKDQPGVIYEICNEPNGDTTWEDIRAYAGQVIPVIRNNSPKAVIIVGTPKFSSDLSAVAEHPVPHENILYAYHYYTGGKGGFSSVLGRARAKGVPVFVSEWGIGDGTKVTQDDELLAKEFIAYMRDNDLSWAAWSLCNKDESYSALLPETKKMGNWEEDDLSTSGKIIFAGFRE
ncbi:glycoside hydrolase family 5 protein [Eubacteriales bacterium OttesenSCG-928-A19]|nr:glycoside hydrolase family 5 protein [Eubacteriales bacterium OttesenSCG-928-A19]